MYILIYKDNITGNTYQVSLPSQEACINLEVHLTTAYGVSEISWKFDGDENA